jgi:hypothetical protein
MRTTRHQTARPEGSAKGARLSFDKTTESESSVTVALHQYLIASLGLQDLLNASFIFIEGRSANIIEHHCQGGTSLRDRLHHRGPVAALPRRDV